MASILDDSISRGYSAAPAFAAPSVAVVPGASGGLADGGLLSTVLLLSLLGGNGLGGNRNDCVTNEAFNQKTLGEIKESIPFNEAQVQLALAGAVTQLTNQGTINTNSILAGQTAAALAAVTNQALLTRDIAAVDTNVDRAATTIVNTIRDDGNATRALITENVIQSLRDDKVILANELAEIRNERNRDRDRHGVEITMVQNAQQVALQNQEINNKFDRMQAMLFDTIQSVRAVNQAINIGGTQTANPLNNNTNVRA